MRFPPRSVLLRPAASPFSCCRIAALFLAMFMSAPAEAGSVDGLLTDMRNRPVAGATVQLVAHQTRYLMPEDLKPADEVRSDLSGRFRLETPGPTSGPLALLVSSPGLERIRIPLKDSGAHDVVNIRLGQGVDVEGVVTDENGLPVPDAIVGPLAAAEDSERPGSERVAPQWTAGNTDGSFAFAHVAPDDQYTLQVSAPGFQTARLSVRPGTGPQQVRLLRGGSSFSGELYGANMLPFQHAGTPVVLTESGTTLATRADKEGRFSFSGIPPGDYSLQAMPDPPRVGQTLSLSFPDDAGTSAGLRISGGYFVEGTAVNWESSTPAVGVLLEIAGTTGVTDSEGHFRIGPLLRPGFIEVTLPAATSEWRISPEPKANPRPLREADGFSDVRDVQVRLRPNRTMQVRVLNFEVSTGPLTLHLLGGDQERREVALTTSPMTIALDSPGRQWAYAEGGSFVSDLRGFEVTSASLVPRIEPPGNRPGELVLYLQQPARLDGMALRADSVQSTGTPVADCRIRLLVPETSTTSSQPVVLASTLTDANGRFAFERMPAAPLDCTALTPSRSQEITQKVDLRPGLNRAQDFVFQPGQVFAGEVVDEEGAPVPGAQLLYYARLDPNATKQGETVTDATGRFTAADIQGSSIELVQITHPDYASSEEKMVALPAQGLRYTLRRQQGLRFQVEAPEDTVWLVGLMRARRWGEPPYAEQLLGEEAGKITVPGGKPAEFRPSGDGLYYLVARGPLLGFAVSQPIQWSGGRAAREELVRLDPQARGRIVGTLDGAPSDEEVRVVATNTWMPERSAPDEYRVIAENGRFTVSDLMPGNYLLVAEGQSYAATAGNVEVTPGASVNITLSPSALNDVTGLVLLGGEPVPDALVRLVSQTVPGSKARETRTDGAGTFSFRSLSPDSYLVEAQAESQQSGVSQTGALRVQRSVQVGHEEQEIGVELDLTPPRLVRFTLPGAGAGNGDGDGALSLTSLQSREVVRARWTGSGYEAPARPGTYEISRGDRPMGRLEVAPDGTSQVSR